MNVNYDIECEKILKSVKNLKTKPTLLLHSCCAPCSTSVIERLKDYFDLTVFYYNPNIFPDEEYILRLSEQKRFLKEKNIPLIEGEYEKEDFYSRIKGLENEKEGGRRCDECIALRIEKTSCLAKEKGYDYFCTTLSVSPLKNAKVINEEGVKNEKRFGVKFLPSDFKKKDGYLNSIKISKEFGLYRQHYCGCEFSLKS